MLATPFEMPQMPVIEVDLVLKESILDAFTLAEGVFEGVATRSNLTEIQTCLGAIDADEKDIEDIIDDFKSPSLSKIIDGAKKLAALITDKKIQSCDNMGDDFKRITAWGHSILTDPTQVLKNVEKNALDMIKEVPKIDEDYSAGSFKTAGDDIAQIVTDVFGTAPTAEEIKNLY